MVEITDRKNARTWFRTQPPKVIILLAARAALRVVPAFLLFMTREPSPISAILLPSLRGMAMPWFMGTWLGQSVGPLQRLRAAYATTRTVEATRANAAARSANAAARAASADSAANAATRAADAARYAADIPAASATYVALSADATAIEAGESVAALSKRPLWPDETPEVLARQWEKLRDLLQARDAGPEADGPWWVWTEWYERRLDGEANLNEALELARVTEPTEEQWRAGPAVINPLLAEIEHRFRGPRINGVHTGLDTTPDDPPAAAPAPKPAEKRDRAEDPEPDPELVQQPAAYRVYWRDGRIFAEPFQSDLVGADADAHYEALKESLAELVEATRGANAALEQLAHRRAHSLLSMIDGGLSALDTAALGPALNRFARLDDSLNSSEGLEQASAAVRHLVSDALDAIETLATLSPQIGSILLRRQLLMLKDEQQRATLVESHRRIRLAFGLQAFEGFVDASTIQALRFGEGDLEEIEAAIVQASDLTLKERLAARRDDVIKDQMLTLNNVLSAVLEQIEEIADAKTSDDWASVPTEVLAKVREDLPAALAGEIVGMITRLSKASLIALLGLGLAGPTGLLAGVFPLLFERKSSRLEDAARKSLSSHDTRDEDTH